MYENITYEILLERMLGRVSEKLDKRPSALIYDTHSATAVELQNLYIELEYLVKNSFGDTAAREYLILLCKDRGITPKPATHAVLQGAFTPEGIDVTGQRFNVGDINYVVKEQIAPGQYEVECESVGSVGNQYLGDMIPMEYIRGLQTACLTQLLIPGEEEEDTEELRQRYFRSFQEKSFGGNRADYLAKVNGMDGVGGCKVTRVWNDTIRPAEMIPSETVKNWYQSVMGKEGEDAIEEEAAAWLSTVYQAACDRKLTVGGTVLITVIDSFGYDAVSDTLLDKIRTELDPEEYAGEGYGLAPIGHVVRVESAKPVRIDIATAISYEDGYSWNMLKESIQEAISAYFMELRKGWAESNALVVRISHVESRILAVKGVADIKDTKLNGSGENIILGKYEIPVPGVLG